MRSSGNGKSRLSSEIALTLSSFWISPALVLRRSIFLSRHSPFAVVQFLPLIVLHALNPALVSLVSSAF